MAVCRQYQIPHSEYRSWSPEDRGKALAYERHLQERCPHCRTSREDWFDENDKLKDPDEIPWVAVVRHCQGCEEYERVNKTISTDQRGEGYFTTWIPSDDWTPDDDQVIDDLSDRAAQAKLAPRPMGLGT